MRMFAPLLSSNGTSGLLVLPERMWIYDPEVGLAPMFDMIIDKGKQFLQELIAREGKPRPDNLDESDIGWMFAQLDDLQDNSELAYHERLWKACYELGGGDESFELLVQCIDDLKVTYEFVTPEFVVNDTNKPSKDEWLEAVYKKLFSAHDRRFVGLTETQTATERKMGMDVWMVIRTWPTSPIRWGKKLKQF
jgi:hypothetical protein